MHGLSTGITFNGLEWPLTRISKSQHFSALNISETTRDRAIVTVERQCTLSNADIFNDLDRPLVRFQGHGIVEVEHIKNGASYGQSYYRTLIGNHTQSIEWYHIQ